jgi:ABC-type uncharacterized transport system involved in gliding motility auxiliary subunit
MALMKNSQPNKYAGISLIVSLIALVATALIGLVKGAMALGLFTPENPDTINLALTISASLTVLGLAVYTMLAPDTVRQFLSGRQARYGSNAILMALAFAGFVIVANYLAMNNPKILADLTEDKANTLAPEMITALKSLPEKMTATAFFSQNPKDSAQQLLENMKSNSQGNFDYRFVDPVANPLEAKTYGVTGDGKIVLEMSGRREIAAYADEAEILRAMNRVLNPENRTVYFLIGHGERDTNGNSQESMSRAREILENKNYTVKTLNLSAENAVPADALAVIIAGPSKPVSKNEVSLLNDYVSRGGALVVMEDPIPMTDFGDSPDPLADSLERVWGILLRNDIVIDTNGNPVTEAVANMYNPDHPITRSMNNIIAKFPFARGIDLTASPEGVNQTVLVQTVDQAWGETDFVKFEKDGQVGYNNGVDFPGPVTLVASGESTAGNGRVVVFGNSAFATDQTFDTYGNGDLFINAVDWAAGNENPVDITIRPTTQRNFNPPGQIPWIAIILGSVCIIPSLVLAAGIAAWIARRRRG